MIGLSPVLSINSRPPILVCWLELNWINCLGFRVLPVFAGTTGGRVTKTVVGMGWGWRGWGWRQRADCFNLTETLHRRYKQYFLTISWLWMFMEASLVLLFDFWLSQTSYWVLSNVLMTNPVRARNSSWPFPRMVLRSHSYHTISRVRSILQICPALTLHRWGNRGAGSATVSLVSKWQS